MTVLARPDEQSGSKAPRGEQAADKAERILDHVIEAKGGPRRASQVELARLVATNIAAGAPTLLQGGTGIGKALDVTTPITTPNGFVPIGELKVGDQVFDERGHQCAVTAAYEVLHDRPWNEVVFSDGTAIVADEEHLWDAIPYLARFHPDRDRNDRWSGASTITPAELSRTLTRPESGRNRFNHVVPVA